MFPLEMPPHKEPVDAKSKQIAELQNTIHDLTLSIRTLQKHVERQNSYVFSFGMAITRGVGYAVGATVLVSLVAAGAVRFLEFVDFVPMVQSFFDSDFFNQLLFELNQL
ncbi:MAG: hypothetical protein WAU07_02165 [Microgenomates group bacterium]